MPRELPVTEVMTREVVSVSPDATIEECAKVFTENGISGAPVVDESGELVGMVEDDDLIIEDARVHMPTYIQILGAVIPLPGSQEKYEKALREAAGVATVAEIMDTEPFLIDASATVEEVATALVEHHLSRLPVVEDGKLVGVVTRTDLVRALASEAD